MDDKDIIQLYWNRDEKAITETSSKYGNYELLGEVDDKQVKNAETTPLGKSKGKWIGLGVSVAACFVILFGVLMWHVLSSNNITDNSGEFSSESSDSYSRDIEIEHDNIDIYYLDNNEIKCVSEFLPCDPQVIFESWKSHNGIGDEVKLIKVKVSIQYPIEIRMISYIDQQ